MKYEYFINKDFNAIMKTQKVSSLVAKAIEAYNLSIDKDLKLESPYNYKGMQEIVTYLLQAINERKKIVIYGDYDVDGICSVSILKRMFELMNTNVGYYIPNRYKDGYGLTKEKTKEIIEKKYDIIICIDNGINAHDSIQLARDNGLEVLVLDHHQLNGQLPNCNYFLHPQLSQFTDYNMCASSIAYYLSIALLGREDEKCAILAGIATLSDIMPLIKQNKLLLKNAIKLLNQHKYKNLDLLIDENEYDENTLSMILIPRLNSVGRIIKDNRVNSVIKFLFEEDRIKTLEYAKFILNCNENRKLLSNEFFDSINDNCFSNIIVLKDENLLEGVCGIISSRLVNTYDIPSIVFAKSEDGNYYKGSARSIEGINIVEALSKLNYLTNFGGHEKAAGLTIKSEDFQRFKEDISEIISDLDKVEIIKTAVLINQEELTYKSYIELLKYGPFGEGNPYPTFALNNITKDKISFSKDKKHLIIKISNDVTLLGFNLANMYQEKYNNYRAIFTLGKNNLISNKLSCKCIEVVGDNNE